jgi:hypothetical protein
VVVHNYCRNADHFLCYLAEREIAVEAAAPAEVSKYLRAAVRWFRKRHGYILPRPHGIRFREQQSMRCTRGFCQRLFLRPLLRQTRSLCHLRNRVP